MQLHAQGLASDRREQLPRRLVDVPHLQRPVRNAGGSQQSAAKAQARDATVVAILPTASEATILALQMLHRRGFAVTAILNFYDDYEFGVAAAMLTATGISVQHLKDEASVNDVCRQFALR